MTDPTRDGDRIETTITTSLTVTGPPTNVFERTIEELETSLRRREIRFETGTDGRIVETERTGANGGDEFEVGRVETWDPGERIEFAWRPASWEPEDVTILSLVFEEVEDGTRVTVEHRGWGRQLDDSADLVGWYAGEVLTPLVAATTPGQFGDWLTDRQARVPTGENARSIYSEPRYHYPLFEVVLEELAVTADDYLLEIGCGGGAFLERTLERGCRAAAIDHSHEMVQVAERVNHDAVEAGRLEVREANAEELPFDDGTFTCATMINALGLLDDPVEILAAVRRVLDDDGRIVVSGSDPELRGTIAAPEPLASRLQFYDSDDLERLAEEAGFEEVRVVRHTLEPYAREAGIPDEHLSLFDYPARLLCGRTG